MLLMESNAKTIAEYLKEIPEDRKESFEKLRKVIRSNLPDGFREEMTYGMIGYVVPLSLYPAGYHVAPKTPLPFANLASQKNHIALYHMGLYLDKDLMEWFVKEYPKYTAMKLDMGKSCIRFKKPGYIPFELIGKLMRRMTVQEWIVHYEKAIKR